MAPYGGQEVGIQGDMIQFEGPGQYYFEVDPRHTEEHMEHRQVQVHSDPQMSPPLAWAATPWVALGAISWTGQCHRHPGGSGPGQ